MWVVAAVHMRKIHYDEVPQNPLSIVWILMFMDSRFYRSLGRETSYSTQGEVLCNESEIPYNAKKEKRDIFDY